ncbi:TPA: glycosyltransferase family 2 protein [Streptococcus suis]
MKTLTIVIPSYNTEDFIDKSLPTFIDDRLFKFVEVLLINDGSTDNTSKICQQYVDKYPEYFKLINKENGGHGSVINIGLKLATGKYFKVVDGDDWVDTENLVKLVEYLNEINADVVLNTYYTINLENNGEKKLQNIPLKDSHFYSFDDVVDNLNQLQIHTLTIKTELMRENNVLVTEKCFYEDFQYSLFTVPYIESLIFYDFPVYNYLIGQKSQSVSNLSVFKNHNMLRKILFDSILYNNRVRSILSEKKREFFDRNISILAKQTYNAYLRNSNQAMSFDYFLEFDGLLKEESEYFYNEVSNRFFYIKVLRLKNKLVFEFLSKLLTLYKKG